MSGWKRRAPAEVIDPVELQVFRHLFTAIPEEMGAALRLSAFSPNIKERLDFSCALTGEGGRMVAQASHIPVHLGSTHVTAGAILATLPLSAGDVVLVNDPWRGGTHLPDITLFAPVFLRGDRRPSFGVLCRAHHADVGGATPGSMGPACDVFGEGLVIPPVRLVKQGVPDGDLFAMVLANTRTPAERRGDLDAQLAAVRAGAARVLELETAYGRSGLLKAAASLERHSQRATEAMLRRLADGTGSAEVAMDLPGDPVIRVRLEKRGARLVVDFEGTGPALPAPFNANEAITLSCVFYAVRLLLDEDLPTNSGCLAPVEVRIPAGCLLNAPRPAAVAGGNVETSQAVVEALLLALAGLVPGGIPAASQGTMNNVTVGGRAGKRGAAWTFYETLGGGAGAGPQGPGESGVQTHMTNTMNTPVEALENEFPLRVAAYRLRAGSGGAGRFRGGEGLLREFEFLAPVRATVLAGRRRRGPPGAAGGGPGAPGRDSIVRGGRVRPVRSGETVDLEPGDRLRIETPGGGGYGPPPGDDRLTN